MKRAMIRIGLALLSGLLFCHGIVTLASAEDHSSAERDCETVGELLTELRRDIGGVINLTGDGPFEMDISADIEVTHPVTVKLPPDGIEIAEVISPTFRGPITFSGTRCFTVNLYAAIYLYDGASIEAREGAGGEEPVAVHLMDSAGGINADSSVTIRAEGDNAVAILSDGDCYLSLGYATVSACGDGSAAIYGGGYLDLHQAFVIADGDDSYAIFCTGDAELRQVSVTGAVEADTVYSILSLFSQTPQNLEEPETEPDIPFLRTVVYRNLSCGSPSVDFTGLISLEYKYQMQSLLHESIVAVGCQAAWDLDGLDYSVPGDYAATATLQPLMPVPGLSVPSITHEVTVVSENRAALYKDRGVGSYVTVCCLTPIENAEEILFWVYEDDGGWREMTATGNAIYANEWSGALHPDLEFYEQYPFFQLTGLEEDSMYWVVAQVVGGPMDGFSNLWQIYTGTELGGDRTGTDRYGTKPSTLPPLSEAETPPPEKDTSDTSGESDSDQDNDQADSSTPAVLAPAAKSAPAVQEFPISPAVSVPVEDAEIAEISEEPPVASLPEEWEDEATVAISGKRLLALLDSGEPVIFIKHGARILVDRDALLALRINGNQLFTVEVTPAKEGYTVRFWLDGAEIDLPYTLILPENTAAEEPEPPETLAVDWAEINPVDLSTPNDDSEASARIPFAAILMIGGGLTSGGGYWLVRKRLLPHR